MTPRSRYRPPSVRGSRTLDGGLLVPPGGDPAEEHGVGLAFSSPRPPRPTRAGQPSAGTRHRRPRVGWGRGRGEGRRQERGSAAARKMNASGARAPSEK